MKYFIKTFGCSANTADSERIATVLENRGMKPASSIKSAKYLVINTCMVRESAENRVYGLINNSKDKHIVLTGCMVGMAVKDKSGKFMKRLKGKFPTVNEILPIEEVGFEITPLRKNKDVALVPISNGCNNFCTYCVVPYTRGREMSRPYSDIIKECKSLKFKSVLLLGQNVNNYPYFPKLLNEVAKMGFEKVDFMSSNPWNFPKDLIDVITRNPNITRDVHLPVQSGDDGILKKMNRKHTVKQYLSLVKSLKSRVEGLRLSTDIIVGFPTETEEQFQNTVDLCEKIGFYKAYISIYSPRPMAVSTKIYPDDISHKEKRRRWLILENLINKK